VTGVESNCLSTPALLTDQTGLTSPQAANRRVQYGANSMPETRVNSMRRLIDKLWSPIPWMLEISVLLQLLIHKFAEAAVVAALLAFNAVVGFVQEGKAQDTLSALKSRLALEASIKRDGHWSTRPAAEPSSDTRPSSCARPMS
jgi:H+-transporting ATPase